MAIKTPFKCNCGEYHHVLDDSDIQCRRLECDILGHPQSSVDAGDSHFWCRSCLRPITKQEFEKGRV